MPEVRLKQYLATLRVRLSEEVVLQHSSSSPVVIGTELAHQVHDYVKQQKMGYYPALNYFSMEGISRQQGLDPDLIDAADSMSWLVSRLVSNEIKTKLRHVFSSLEFQTIQTIAYTMPAVRYGGHNAVHNLIQHYTPLSVKLEIVVSMISKQQTDESIEDLVRNALCQKLEDSFEVVDVSSVIEISSS